MIAYEMARLLRCEGAKVAFLGEAQTLESLQPCEVGEIDVVCRVGDLPFFRVVNVVDFRVAFDDATWPVSAL